MTHNVTFLPQMDRIVVMEAGRIMETGSYDQLIDQEGSFAEFLVKHLGQTPETESDDGVYHMKAN